MTANEQAYNTNAGFWVQIIREDRDRYRKGLTDPAILDAIGEAHGLAVLDAGCGEGYMSRTLAGNGAKVTGIDVSAELIKAAKAHQLPMDCRSRSTWAALTLCPTTPARSTSCCATTC